MCSVCGWRRCWLFVWSVNINYLFNNSNKWIFDTHDTIDTAIGLHIAYIDGQHYFYKLFFITRRRPEDVGRGIAAFIFSIWFDLKQTSIKLAKWARKSWCETSSVAWRCWCAMQKDSIDLLFELNLLQRGVSILRVLRWLPSLLLSSTERAVFLN